MGKPARHVSRLPQGSRMLSMDEGTRGGVYALTDAENQTEGPSDTYNRVSIWKQRNHIMLPSLIPQHLLCPWQNNLTAEHEPVHEFQVNMVGHELLKTPRERSRAALPGEVNDPVPSLDELPAPKRPFDLHCSCSSGVQRREETERQGGGHS